MNRTSIVRDDARHSGTGLMALARRAAVAAAVGLAVLVWGVPQAQAQFGRGWGDAARPQVTSKHIDRIAEMLSFSESQRDFASDLLQAYIADVDAIREELELIMDGAREEWRETRDPQVWRDLGEAMEPFRAKGDELKDRLMEDLQLILDAEQADEWERVERYHRRATSLSDDGLLSGESVDIIAAVDRMELTEEQLEVIQPLLRRYELDADRAIRERDKVYEEGMEGAMELWQNQDFDEMQKRFDKAREVAQKLRDLNRRYARQIETALAGGVGERFGEVFKEESFPRVYGENRAGEAMEKVLSLDTLTPEQAEQVMAIQDDFNRELATINERLASAIEEGEMNRQVTSFFGRARSGESEDIRRARDRRRELMTQTIDRVREVLTEEQAEVLPSQRRIDWRDRVPGERRR